MPSFRVGKPRVRLARSTLITLVGPGPWPIPWDLVEYEDPVVWNPLTPTIYTIPKTGLWQVDLCADIGGAGANRRLDIRVNGVSRVGQAPGSSFSGSRPYAVSLQDELQVGDVVDGYLTLSTAGNATVAATMSHLALTRIGPERWTG